MTKYVIKSNVTAVYVCVSVSDGYAWNWANLPQATRFDSMTEANLFALQHAIANFTVEPVAE